MYKTSESETEFSDSEKEITVTAEKVMVIKMPIIIHQNQNQRPGDDAEFAKLKAELERLSDPHGERRGYLFAKRLFDIVFSAAVLLGLGPILLLIALLVFIDDPHGSPIYVQTRVGQNGKEFRFYKFRSMVVNADAMLCTLEDKNEKSGPVFKMKDDPRITRIGRFLRRTSLDELPQFLNVLLGTMSVVGPRPALPGEVAQYSEYHRLRLLAVPGLTCFWQTCDNRDAVEFEQWVDMDLKYIRERNLLLDIKLIFRTVKVMLTGQGT